MAKTESWVPKSAVGAIFGLLLGLLGSRELMSIAGPSQEAPQTLRFHFSHHTANNCAVVYGNQAELIQIAPIIRNLKANADVCKLIVIRNDQRTKLLLQLEKYFLVTPDVSVDLSTEGQGLGHLAAHSFDIFSSLWMDLQPRMVFVQGGSTTGLMAAMAAFHANVDVMHIEAGLNTGDLSAPFPEEFNRQTLGSICTLCFAPTEQAAVALRNEAVNESRIVVAGTTAIDSLQYALAHLPFNVNASGAVVLNTLVSSSLRSSQLRLSELTDELLAHGRHVVLVAVRQREKAQESGFQETVRAIARLSKRHRAVKWVFCVLESNAVREKIASLLHNVDNVWLIEPPAYPDFMQLLQRVSLIVSDGGGLLEEGLALSIPVLITSSAAERMEGVRAGGAQLVGSSAAAIEAALEKLLQDRASYARMASAPNPYGDGTAAQRIVSAVAAWQRSLPNNTNHVAAAALARSPQWLAAASGANVQPTAVSPSARPSIASYASPVACPSVSTATGKEKATPTPAIKYPINPKHAFAYRVDTLTVVLTGYKRSAQILDMQLQALQKGSLQPTNIVLFQNENHVDFTAVLSKWPQVQHMHSKGWNTKFHGRFAIALMFDTEFVAIADDTNIPGPKWLEAAVHAAKVTDGIIGNSGRSIEAKKMFTSPQAHYQRGRDTQVNGRTPQPVQVDFVGHWWVCRTYHLRAMWSFAPPTLWTAEDIHLSAAAQLAHGAKSYVLDVPSRDYNPELPIPGSLLANDHPSYKVSGTDDERAAAVQYWVKQGWRPLDFML